MTRKPGAPLGFFLTSAQSLNIKAMSAKTSKISADLEDYLERLVSAVERAVDGISANKPGVDWHAKYLALQEQYTALSSLYQSLVDAPPVADKNNEYLLSFFDKPTPEETASNGLVQVKDLLDAAIEANTNDVFEVMEYYFANAKGDVQELVKIKKKTFDRMVASKFTSNLAFNLDDFTILDLVRVCYGFYNSGMVGPRVGKELTQKEFFDTMGKVFDVDLSKASKSKSNSVGSGCREETQTAIFDVMKQAPLNKSVGKKSYGSPA